MNNKAQNSLGESDDKIIEGDTPDEEMEKAADSINVHRSYSVY